MQRSRGVLFLTDYQKHDDTQVETTSETSENMTTHTNTNIANNFEQQIEFPIPDRDDEGEGIVEVKLFVLVPAQALWQTNYVVSLDPINQISVNEGVHVTRCAKGWLMSVEVGTVQSSIAFNGVRNCPALLASMKSQKRNMRNERLSGKNHLVLFLFCSRRSVSVSSFIKRSKFKIL